MHVACRPLNEKWNENDNKLMSRKLQTCKSRINCKTPNSFVDFTKIHRKGDVENFQDFVKRTNDLNLFKKLEQIYTGKQSKLCLNYFI